ncbi:hypothetical protein FACS189451_01500 [Bacteroidia bacterium]|nr:hypothetical protein FACS189451_01500 [Bacteroidia bacterium]
MSPVFLTENGFRFYTWSKEEPRKHIHVIKDEKYCKFWLEPLIELAENKGFKSFELNQIIKIIKQNEKSFNKKWIEHFG